MFVTYCTLAEPLFERALNSFQLEKPSWDVGFVRIRTPAGRSFLTLLCSSGSSNHQSLEWDTKDIRKNSGYIKEKICYVRKAK